MKFKVSQDKTKLILKESNQLEYKQLRNHLKPKVKNYQFMPRYKLRINNWDGTFDYFNNGNINIGLWNECYNLCKEYQFPFEIENKEEFPRDENIKIDDVQLFSDEFFKYHKQKDGTPFVPYEHQIEAVYKLLKHRYGLIKVATAGGKSLILSIIFFYILTKINPNAKFLLIVPSISLVTQFYDDIIDYNLGFNKENLTPLKLSILEIMSDKPRKVRDDETPNIYIGTYQSLINWGTPDLYPDFFKQFDLVAVDEADSAKSKSLNTILSKTFSYAKYRIGVCGTFPPELSNELMSIESLTGPILMTVKAKELMEKGLISDVKIRSLILQYNDEDFAKSIQIIKKHGNGKKALELENEYIQKSSKRMSFIGKLINKFNHNSIVLFFNTEYGTDIYNYLRSNIVGKDFYYIDGHTPSEKRKYIIKQMEVRDDKPKILVASYGTLSTGISIKALKNVVFTQSFKSTRIILQSIGRSLRLHADKKGDKAIIYDLVDQFFESIKTILFDHYCVRKKDIYEPEQYEYEEIKLLI